MVAYQKFNQFVEDLAHKVHDLAAPGDQLEIALTPTASAPVAANSILGDLTETVYTNLSARTITKTSSAQTAGVYKLTLTDLVLTATGAVAPFQYVVVFNQATTSPLDALLGFYNHGSSVTLANGETYTIDWDDSGGFITIT